MRTAASEQLCAHMKGHSESMRSWRLASFVDAVLVISLNRRRHERRDALLASLRRHGASRVEVVDAVDGRSAVRANPSLWERRMHTDEVDELKPADGAIGCFLSHYAAHRLAEKLQLQTYLVLEDDAAFTFAHIHGERFRRAMQQLPAGWDALWLGYNSFFKATSPGSCRPLEPSTCRAEGEPAICRARKKLIDAHAIIFHARARRWLMPLLAKADEKRTRLMPYDLELRFHMEKHSDVAMYAMSPAAIVSQNKSFASDISPANDAMYEAAAPTLKHSKGHDTGAPSAKHHGGKHQASASPPRPPRPRPRRLPVPQ